ncbi:protein phosphatase 1 regulatory subunit 3B isoform X1 [Tribolium castaneum]|uniref:protein phosphatase 1 regulatory subunit 3B isoform X1 n=1 Tax=Tribolium castaneum TaxID=7070 RepID=UPI00077DE031|nr:PREDICTED: protein phosphatase 1 regulatory subunit 3B isoform X1 [Tribolium castaneum]|eukprot:XP_015840075.1 PREDICTED: protein phosphatase 1 regulatory subunit 3B isoform X1 [Tribolium castaneum]
MSSRLGHQLCRPMCPAVAYEMLVAHSPPVFSHSPPTGYLSDYTSSFRFNVDHIPRPCRIVAAPSTTQTLPNKSFVKKMPASPKRPCLVIRPDDTSVCNDEDPTSPTRLKKKVVFADDKGMSLTHVRVMTEPSNVPPLWSYRFLAEVTQGLSAEPEVVDEPWEITFPQPASDYVQFRKTLETKKVSLENVIVKEPEDLIVGTVKVNNISFQKEVIVRISSDNWKTFEDAFCNFVPNAGSSMSPAYVLYDTFSFKIPLRPRAKKVEFCVCFRCNENEYWDNNDGKNYIIMKKIQDQQRYKTFTEEDFYKRTQETDSSVTSKCTDAIQAKLDSWSEFASWTHLDNSGPYW